MKAIQIYFDMTTGKRPGDIDVRGDNNLWCGPGWQCLDTNREIRLVVDGDISKYKNNEDIIILNNEQEITDALNIMCPPTDTYKISNKMIVDAELRNRHIDFSTLSQEATEDEELAFLYTHGIRGILKKTKIPGKPADVAKSVEAKP